MHTFSFAKAGWNGLVLAVISLLAIERQLSRILHKQRAAAVARDI